jgi:hypothetical protein
MSKKRIDMSMEIRPGNAEGWRRVWDWLLEPKNYEKKDRPSDCGAGAGNTAETPCDGENPDALSFSPR